MAKLKPLVALKDEQLHASDPAELVWLSASAGTGKTHVLSARVLRLLLRGSRPETILCLTFTKAGAAEMAERIHARLASWVGLPDKTLGQELFALDERREPADIAHARTLFAEVLDAPGGGLRIQTIHAFCQTLLGGFPVEAGLTPGFRPLDGRQEAALARRTLADMLVEAERGGRAGLVADIEALSSRLGEAGAETYLMQCARDPEAMAKLGQGIDAKVRVALDLPLGDVEDAILGLCGDCDPAYFDLGVIGAIAAANAAWGTKTGLANADRCAAFLAASPAERAALVEDLVGVVLTKAGEPRSHAAGLLKVEPAYAAHAECLSAACTALTGMRRRAELATVLAAGLRAGQAFAFAYADAKRAAGVLDFDDLIRKTHELLTTEGMGDWVRYKLDQETDHILVDEAQDTNTRQWSIVAALAGEFFAGAGARSKRRRTIFAVGDFKQAIFGFQGTNPDAFRAAGVAFTAHARGVERDMLQLSLDRSFRSTPPILKLVDTLLEQLTAGELGLDERLRPHVSAKANLPGSVTVWRPVSAGQGADEDAEAEEGWIDDATRAFATKLARQIREWLADPFMVAVKGRPLRPEDILILVRRRGDLASLLVARLHAEGVPVAGVDRLRLTAPLAVRDLLSAIRFALQPHDDLNLASLLASPIFGFSQDELYTLGFGRKGSLFNALRENLTFVKTSLSMMIILSQTDFTTPYQFLESLLSGPLDARRKILHRLGEEARDPIDELLNAALLFESDSTPTLQRFLDWFDRGDVEIIRDPSAPLDAVRVMTVHGAKGLQAPVVILADATGDPDAARATSIRWTMSDDLAVPVFRPRKDELSGTALADDLTTAERRDREEHWRLLYVAATRAEERLIVGGALGPRCRGVPPKASWYQAIDTAMAALGADWTEDALWSAVRSFGGGGRFAARSPASPAVTDPLPDPGWLRALPPQESRPPRPLAPSSSGPDRVVDPPPSHYQRAAARRGTLLHALFERLPTIAPEHREAAALRWLRDSAGVDDPIIRAELAGDASAIIADPRYAELFGPDAIAEAPIAAVIDGDVAAGTVDRLAVTEDAVYVVDFKTGRRVPADAASAPEHHLRQMSAYVAALRVIFPGRRVVAALLYTSGPSLLTLDDALLDRHKPGFVGQEQKLPVAG